MVGKSGGKAKEEPIPLLETIAAGIGLAIVVAMFGLLGFEAFKSDGKVPLMEVEPIGIRAASGDYVVEVRISNQSRSSGAAVEVEGVLKRNGADVETSNASFGYVPGQSQRFGALVFTKDPRQYQLELRVTGYERP